MEERTASLMRPLSEIDPGKLRRVRVVLADIDDTITSEGSLTAAAYAALESLHNAGFIVMPVTGRPAGWCDHIARMWPVDAVVGENGAFCFHYDHVAKRMRHRYWAPADERRKNRMRLALIEREILSEVRGSALASDQAYRVVDRIVAIFERHEATAKVSSIHVNGWFGDYDKLSMAKIAPSDLFGLTWENAREAMMYVGDLPNDEPMFAAFPFSVGVANIRAFGNRLRNKPAFVTAGPSGEGFSELASTLLNARQAA